MGISISDACFSGRLLPVVGLPTPLLSRFPFSCMLFIAPVSPNFCLMVCASVFCVDIDPYLRSPVSAICALYRGSVEGSSFYPICILWDSPSRPVLVLCIFFPCLSDLLVITVMRRLTYWVSDECFLAYCAACFDACKICWGWMHFPVFGASCCA